MNLKLPLHLSTLDPKSVPASHKKMVTSFNLTEYQNELQEFQLNIKTLLTT